MKKEMLQDVDTDAVMDYYLKKLQISIGVGVDTLLQIATDDNASRSEKINASSKLIDQAQKAYELRELEQRISAVEKMAEEQKT